MQEYGVEYLYGLSSSINQLAYYGKKMDINPPIIKSVITSLVYIIIVITLKISPELNSIILKNVTKK